MKGTEGQEPTQPIDVSTIEWGGTQVPRRALVNCREFLKSLGQTVKLVALYQPSHPVPAASLQESWRLLQRGTASAALLAGACAGLASAAKYPGVAFVSVVAWAIGERWWLLRSFPSALGLTALASVGFVATFAVACPPCVVHADALLAMLRQHHQMSLFAGFEAACLVPSIGWWQRPWIYELVASLPYGLGLPLAVAAVAGVGVAFRHRTQADRLLLAVLLPYFAFMGASAVVYPRYMLPLFPGLALVAAAGLARTVRLWSATIVVGLVVSYGAALTASQLSRFTWNQQAAVADWLGDKRETLSPEDRRVGVPGILEADPYFHLRQPIAAQGFDVEIERPDRWLRTRPAFFVLPAWQAMAIHRDRRNFLLHAKLMQIEAGHAGYRPVLRIPIPTYLQRWFDEPWDPTFAVELWQGAIGFTVYARDGVLPELQTVDVLPPLPARRAVVPGSSSAG